MSARTFLSCAVLMGCAAMPVHAGMSQQGMEDDCLQRLRPIVPRDVKFKTVGFAALGTQPAYYVVTYQFPDTLANGQRAAACTYRRDGQWSFDDAARYKLARELEATRAR